jgi:hypothetical protein
MGKFRKFVSRNAPAAIVNRYRRTCKKLDARAIFTAIYTKQLWKGGESVSGPGAEPGQTRVLIESLGRLLEALNIRSLLDIPCGDFNWMREVDLAHVDYLGADIVEELIAANKRTYPQRFEVIDLLGGALPKKDLILVRDCFVHLSYKEIFAAIGNIKGSGCRYLLATTFTGCGKNKDICTGNWRKVNLQEKPFNFPSPLLVINENCTEGNGNNKDKSLGLWEIGSL